MPKVSVIVPVYKTAQYLTQCIESILAQSLSDLEVILVDDGSPDECPAICDAFAERDSRVRVLHQRNMGVSAARNNGMDAATAEWITFVDSDDWMEPDAVESLYSLAVNCGCEISVCTYFKDTPHKSELTQHSGKSRIFDMTQDRDMLLGGILIPMSAKSLIGENSGIVFLCSPVARLYRREILSHSKIKFLTNLKRGEDVVFNLYAFNAATYVCFIDRALYHYRIYDSSTCWTLTDSLEKEYEAFMVEVNSFFSKYVQSLTLHSYVDVRAIECLSEFGCIVATGVKSVRDFRKTRRRLKLFAQQEPFQDAWTRVSRTNLTRNEKIFCILLRWKFFGVALGLCCLYATRRLRS